MQFTFLVYHPPSCYDAGRIKSSMKCNQCEKPALRQLEENVFLCLDCYLKFQQAQQIEYDRNIRELNYLSDQMQWTAGLSNVPPRYHDSQPTIQTGPVTQHHIQIHGSVVGAINTGNVHKMNVALDRIKVGGAPELATALKNLTETVSASSELVPEQKTAAVEHLSHIMNQAALPKEQRQAAISRTIIDGFERIISASSDLLNIWKTVKPFIDNLF